MATKKTAKAESAEAPVEEKVPAEEQVAVEQPKKSAKKEPVKETPIVPKEIDPNQPVVVRNGFQGRLVYHSKRTGETWVWDSFGAEQEIELRELKNARNSSRAFFEKNWFMFDEPWIIDYLGVQQYYKHSLRLDQFDEIFQKTPSELKRILIQIPEGQRQSVAYRAKELIASKQIDSLKVIETLESALGFELIER